MVASQCDLTSPSSNRTLPISSREDQYWDVPWHILVVARGRLHPVSEGVLGYTMYLSVSMLVQIAHIGALLRYGEDQTTPVCRYRHRYSRAPIQNPEMGLS